MLTQWQFEMIINVFSLHFNTTAIINISIISASAVIVWLSESDVCRRQILTSKIDPRAVRVNVGDCKWKVSVVVYWWMAKIVLTSVIDQCILFSFFQGVHYQLGPIKPDYSFSCGEMASLHTTFTSSAYILTFCTYHFYISCSLIKIRMCTPPPFEWIHTFLHCPAVAVIPRRFILVDL